MKKDLIFTPAMLIIGALLFLLRATGMTAHIAISAIGVAVYVGITYGDKIIAWVKKVLKIDAPAEELCCCGDDCCCDDDCCCQEADAEATTEDAPAAETCQAEENDFES